MEPGLEETAFYDPTNFVYPAGAYGCEVEVDPETGAVEVAGFWAADDFGVVINPLIVAGQQHGGVVQGIGQALLEHAVYDANGQLVSGSFMDYAMPRAADLPAISVDHSCVTPCDAQPARGQGLRRGGRDRRAAGGGERGARRAERRRVQDRPHRHAADAVPGLGGDQAAHREAGMYAFEFVRPTTVEEAVKALAAEEAQALGGGQTLIPTLKQRLANPGHAGEPHRHRGAEGRGDEGRQALASARGTTACDGRAGGGGATIRRWRRWRGRSAIRRSGTAAPSAAASPTTTPRPTTRRRRWRSGATIVTNAREIAADDYFQGMFTTALDSGEIVTEVRFPVPQRANYQKFQQPASRFALVGVFVAKFGDGVRVAVTGASESGVFRWKEAEAALSGDFRPEAVKGLKASADGMIGDLFGTPEYRAHLIGVLTGRAVAAAG